MKKWIVFSVLMTVGGPAFADGFMIDDEPSQPTPTAEKPAAPAPGGMAPQAIKAFNCASGSYTETAKDAEKLVAKVLGVNNALNKRLVEKADTMQSPLGSMFTPGSIEIMDIGGTLYLEIMGKQVPAKVCQNNDKVEVLIDATVIMRKLGKPIVQLSRKNGDSRLAYLKQTNGSLLPPATYEWAPAASR